MKSVAVMVMYSGALSLITPLVFADSWNLPSTRSYFSDNNHYCLIVIPGGDTLIEASLPENLRFDRPSDLLPHDSAVVILYARHDDSVFRPVWTTVLPERNEPVDAIVNDLGTWVVTFDSWHRMGYGQNVVVILDSHGRVVRRLSLSDLFSPQQIDSFKHTSSSIWWRCGARFIDGTDELELRTVSNGQLPGWSLSTVCEDYLRLQLVTGHVISFYSSFDEILATYDEPCFDDYICPTVRYLYYQMNHPDSTLRLRLDSLELGGNQIDTLRTVYESFCRDWGWQMGAALQSTGRPVRFVQHGLGVEEFLLLVSTHDELYDLVLRDSIPVVVRLPDSTLAFPLAPNESTFVEGVLRGGMAMFDLSYRILSGPEDQGIRTEPMGGLSRVCTPDSTIMRRTNVLLEQLNFGTRVYIDLTK